MQIHVYIEQVLFDNLLMDFSLLFCARTLGRTPAKHFQAVPCRSFRRSLRLPDAYYRVPQLFAA